MQQIRGGSIDLIYADPPYKISPNRRGNPDENPELLVYKGKWNKAKALDKFYLDWMKPCYRILKPRGSLWVSADVNNLETALKVARLVGEAVPILVEG